MARSTDDIELYLRSLERTFNRDGDTFVVATGEVTAPIAIHVADTLALLRVDIGSAPQDDARKLAVFRRLLELNASDLVHGSYGLEGDEIVLAIGLPLENLDLNELGAALADIDLALVRHVKPLRDLTKAT